mmetsp:Transcript_7503/g.21917  ORF Transcript_7503/g.21917 Transcript_7503/m.21917 type:complete len:1185 (+) Transcript_7503:311-3865(+)|eukprot:CAMPEP_0119564638 /NCGR_PEP_ID=MMETSP1352-20130426/27582_1 /TAXON_ID=265584 /ORGANISM="Stauroneis constricta, Strain CCMP1120" /LENGTH=1184 /DNA_ID=CAMNT_0007613413 /DNA_START=253 /DNA_END=3807 /DNA_ORIENTATION=+
MAAMCTPSKEVNDAAASDHDHDQHQQQQQQPQRGVETPIKHEANDGLYDAALRHKEAGNGFFKSKDYASSEKSYQAGLECIQQCLVAPSVPEQSIKPDDPLRVTLLLNLAFACYYQNKLMMAETECSAAMQLDPKNPKALYRRATIREAIGHNNETLLPDERIQVFESAIRDIHSFLAIFQDPSRRKVGKEKKAHDAEIKKARIILSRLEKAIREYGQKMDKRSKRRSTSNNSAAGSVSPTKAVTTNGYSNGRNGRPKSDIPGPSQQKRDVMRLLVSRNVQAASAPMKSGEAFFLIEWGWWNRWCRHVDFFSESMGAAPEMNVQSLQKRVNHTLRMLPPGAVPSNKAQRNLEPKPAKSKSVASDSGTDSDSDMEEDNGTVSPPGPIDNSNLLLATDDAFVEQWYATDQDPAIKPNLVRGYHYEVLPREVYNALHVWYSEITPQICRRTSSTDTIIMYPPHQAPPSSTEAEHNRCAACRAPRATKKCTNCSAVHYCNRDCQEAHWPVHKKACKNGKVVADVHERAGKVGLNNLGNTCFMNSALQCLSHSTPITRYFLSGGFKKDINPDNPLGTGGKLALAYHSTIQGLWMNASKGHTSTSPTDLKRAIALFAPRFAGYQQHDAQEFLAYLLDGLHEDLNRIRKAPYVEMPDVTDGHNMAVAGAEAWNAHQRRNDSLVMDTIYGQFKSTCICPRCKRVSVSFDAFNHISLELPQKDKVQIPVPVYVSQEPGATPPGAESTPKRYGFLLEKGSTLGDLRHAINDKLQPRNGTKIKFCGIANGKICMVLDERKLLSSIVGQCDIGAYEVAPYSERDVHAIVSQSVIVQDEQYQRPVSEVGFPFMLSFDANYTCAEMWNDMWRYVHNFVGVEDPAAEFIDPNQSVRPEDVLTIRVVDENGNSINISTEDDVDADGDEMMKDFMSSVIKRSSTRKIKDALGADCTKSFLFLDFEWREPLLPSTAMDMGGDNDNGNDNDNAATTTNGIQPMTLVDPKRFQTIPNHESYPDMIQKQQQLNNKNKTVSLEECFETFTKPERLDENNKWYCSTCKDHVRALKTMKLWRLPNILVVHLKRFEFKSSFRRDKLDTLVDFPLDGLDMKKHCAQWEESHGSFVDASISSEYDLFAVVNHYGRMGFGHYTAFARSWDEDEISKNWALFDDSNVKPVGNPRTSVVTPAAYVLFYRRRVFH